MPYASVSWDKVVRHLAGRGGSWHACRPTSKRSEPQRYLHPLSCYPSAGGLPGQLESCFAVKRLSPLHQIDFPFLLENEVTCLNYANLCNIPRLIKFKELIGLPHGDARTILE